MSSVLTPEKETKNPPSPCRGTAATPEATVSFSGVKAGSRLRPEMARSAVSACNLLRPRTSGSITNQRHFWMEEPAGHRACNPIESLDLVFGIQQPRTRQQPKLGPSLSDGFAHGKYQFQQRLGRQSSAPLYAEWVLLRPQASWKAALRCK